MLTIVYQQPNLPKTHLYKIEAVFQYEKQMEI